MYMHKTLHLRDDRIYVSRKEGGRGFANIEDRVATSMRQLEVYIRKSKDRLNIATRHNTNNTTRITRKQK